MVEHQAPGHFPKRLMKFCNVLPDFVRWTIKNYTTETSLEEVLDHLGCKFEAKNSGRYLYKHRLSALGGLIEVYYDGEANQGDLCVQITGQGCRMIEAARDFPGWRKWFEMWQNRFNARFSRIDFAVDDEDFSVPFEIVHEHWKNRDFTARARTLQYVESIKNGQKARSVYIGSRQSHCMFRAYERGTLNGDANPWMRFEFEFHAKKADALVETLVQEGWPQVMAACRGEVDFTDPFDDRTVVSRRDAAPWWTAIMDNAKEVIKVGQVVVTDLSRAYKQMKKQWSQKMLVMWEAQGFCLDWLVNQLMETPAKLNDRNRALRELARDKLYSPNFETFVPV